MSDNEVEDPKCPGPGTFAEDLNSLDECVGCEFWRRCRDQWKQKYQPPLPDPYDPKIICLPDYTLDQLFEQGIMDSAFALMASICSEVQHRSGSYHMETPVKLGPSDLAKTCGCSRSTVYRAFNKLIEHGFIKYEKGMLTVIEQESLD